MLGELRELNEEFYELYGRLYENSEFLSQKQTEYMSQCLLEQYKIEYKKLCDECEIERARETFGARLRRSALVPRRWRFLLLFKRKQNKAAELIAEEMRATVERYFKQQKETIAEIEREAESAETEAEDESGSAGEAETVLMEK